MDTDVALLAKDASLQTLQAYVKAVTAERGFDDDTIAQRFMLLIEEIGELARATRTQAGIKVAKDTHTAEVAHEAADVFILLLGLCNMIGVDLGQAFIAKETINRKRVWR